MGWFSSERDRELADTRYAGRKSASETAAEQRRQGHRRNLGKTAAAGQAWEDRDRAQDRKGRWYRPAR